MKISFRQAVYVFFTASASLSSPFLRAKNLIDRLKIEFAAEEQHAEVLETAETPRVGLDGLNDRVEALGRGIGDAVLGVVEQAVAGALLPARQPKAKFMTQ